MTLQEAIMLRHSVRRYVHKPLSAEIVETLRKKIEECNAEGGLHIQLVTNETRAFTGLFSYGKFSGVENYIVMVGRKADDLDERVGYYGEQLVLLAQTLRTEHLLGRTELSQSGRGLQRGQRREADVHDSLGIWRHTGT